MFKNRKAKAHSKSNDKKKKVRLVAALGHLN